MSTEFYIKDNQGTYLSENNDVRYRKLEGKELYDFLQTDDALLRPPGPGGQPWHQSGLEEIPLHRRHRRRGHHHHELGGPAGHQLPAGPPCRRRPKPVPEFASVSPDLHSGRPGLRGGRSDGLLLPGCLHRCVHHRPAGPVVLPVPAVQGQALKTRLPRRGSL